MPARRRSRKTPVECAIDGCGTITANYCTATYQMAVCQSHAAKLAVDGVYLKVVLVEPTLDAIAADQREAVTE